jgi:SAM-dependent methyltransferase
MRSLLSHVSYAARSLAKAWIYRLPGERERCPACESAHLFDLDMIRFRRARSVGFVTACSDCGLVFTNPLPLQEDLARFYSPSGEWASTHARTDADRSTRSRKRRGRGRWISQFDVIREELRVTAPPPGARVLDYGCGAGQDLDVLQDFGWETWGLETASDEAFDRHLRVQVVPDAPTFDLVILNHVLEHVTNPLGLLRQLSRACRVGGFLLVGVPRFDTLPIHRDYAYVINGRAHVTAYTPECLEGLLARSGFRLVSSTSSGSTQPAQARLRVLAKRVDGRLPLPASPGRRARQAVRSYYKGIEDRPMLARFGLVRLAARLGNFASGR